ncbi:MAG: hypothetical protein JWQ97_1405 [Phenylobacterium sp.]|nr:hypothetical protein [Phenylobacterium sp.]
MDSAIEEAVAKLAITDVLHRYARGMDRMDKALTLSCWHPGGTDDHAPLYSGAAEGFVEWLWPVHAAMEATRHMVTNIIIEVDAERAASECYWMVTLRLKGADGVRYDTIGQGRYIDTFERIDGVWAIRHRQSLCDWGRIEPVGLAGGEPGAPTLIKPNNPETSPPTNARDRTDYSYQVLRRAH